MLLAARGHGVSENTECANCCVSAPCVSAVLRACARARVGVEPACVWYSVQKAAHAPCVRPRADLRHAGSSVGEGEREREREALWQPRGISRSAARVQLRVVTARAGRKRRQNKSAAPESALKLGKIIRCSEFCMIYDINNNNKHLRF